jgi:hypothetical protein
MSSGGVRAIEVTFSKSSGYAGYHAHAHCIFELAPGVTLDEFKAFVLAAWCVDGAKPSAQDFRLLDEARIGQLAKYVNKPLEDVADNVVAARELFESMFGRRMIDGFGAWRGWRRAAQLDDDAYKPEALALAKMNPGELLQRTYDPDTKHEPVEFVSRSGQTVRLPAIEAVESLERHRGETWGDEFAARAHMQREGVLAAADEALANILAYEAGRQTAPDVPPTSSARLSFHPPSERPPPDVPPPGVPPTSDCVQR